MGKRDWVSFKEKKGGTRFHYDGDAKNGFERKEKRIEGRRDKKE